MLLSSDDPPCFELVNPEGGAHCLLIADHAGRAIPKALGRLGLADADLDRHAAYDIGIETVSRRLATMLDAPLLLHRHSRLVIDPNRALDSPTSICADSDGTRVPANAGLSPADAAARADALFHPWHAAITAWLTALEARGGGLPALVSLHSFTPMLAYENRPRPWHVGILWNTDGRLATPLLTRLASIADVVVGDNEPYSGRAGRGYTMHRHAESHGRAHVLVELRQDLIADEAGAALWAGRLAAPLADRLADPQIYAKQSAART